MSYIYVVNFHIRFSKKTVEFLHSFGFDGIDLDWEFPAWPWLKGDRREKKWFTCFLERLNYQLKVKYKIYPY